MKVYLLRGIMTPVEKVVLEVHANQARANDRCSALNDCLKSKPEMVFPEEVGDVDEQLAAHRASEEAYDTLYKAWEAKHPNPKYTFYDAFDVVTKEVSPEPANNSFQKAPVHDQRHTRTLPTREHTPASPAKDI